MAWTVALVVALLNGLLCGVAVVPLSFGLMRAHGKVDRDGGMSMGIVFQVAPITFVLAALLGLWGSHLAGATGWEGFWPALGISAGIGLGVMGLFALTSLLGIVRAPKLDGAELLLRVEVTVPRSSLPGGTPDRAEMRLSLYAGDKDNHYGELDLDGIRAVGDHYLIPGQALLRSVSPARMLTLQVAPDTSFVLDMPLAASPGRDDLGWAGPFTTREGRLRDGRLQPTPVTMRYRLEKVPTPSTGRK
jgi:MFS family permease